MARISSKLERAVRALLILQNKATDDDCFISNDSRTSRKLPNRTILASAQMQERSYREEGVVHLGIQHHFAAADQPNDARDTQRTAMDAYVEATEATIFGFDAQGKDLNVLAGAITAAGRSLATAADGSGEAVRVATQNADMANFRCDWVKCASPYLTRGQAQHEKGITWVEILNFAACVSTASVDN